MSRTRHYDKDAIVRRMRQRREERSGRDEKDHRAAGILLYVFVALAALLFLFLIVGYFGS